MKWKIFWINLIILSFFILDRFLKKLFLLGSAADYQFGLFSFYLSKTSKLFFGFSVTNIWLNCLTLLIIIFLIYKLKEAYSKKEITSLIAFTLILVGGASNILDRLIYGFVIDYIDLGRFCVFNLADLMIWAGVGILLVRIIRQV